MSIDLHNIPDVNRQPELTTCGMLARPLFFITVILGTTLTGISLFTPGWFQIHSSTTGTSNYGIILQSYQDWWIEQPSWEKAVIVLMTLAFVIEIILVFWAMLSFIPACIPSLFIPVPIFSGIAAILLVFCVALYIINIQKEIDIIKASSFSLRNIYAENNETFEGNVTYSFWIAVAAMAIMIFSTFLGCLTAVVTPTL